MKAYVMQRCKLVDGKATADIAETCEATLAHTTGRALAILQTATGLSPATLEDQGWRVTELIAAPPPPVAPPAAPATAVATAETPES